ncbi:MAG: hypothetical protein P4L91_20200 [Burkholderiaceae bacterium]|nr:hypothetical protein [Burkholderiaceae bacterium]
MKDHRSFKNFSQISYIPFSLEPLIGNAELGGFVAFQWIQGGAEENGEVLSSFVNTDCQTGRVALRRREVTRTLPCIMRTTDAFTVDVNAMSLQRQAQTRDARGLIDYEIARIACCAWPERADMPNRRPPFSTVWSGGFLQSIYQRPGLWRGRTSCTAGSSMPIPRAGSTETGYVGLP